MCVLPKPVVTFYSQAGNRSPWKFVPAWMILGGHVELPANPLAGLTFISAPKVLTNASCVLLFGTGNRYGRAVDRVHELADAIEAKAGLAEPELELRIRQLEAG